MSVAASNLQPEWGLGVRAYKLVLAVAIAMITTSILASSAGAATEGHDLGFERPNLAALGKTSRTYSGIGTKLGPWTLAENGSVTLETGAGYPLDPNNGGNQNLDLNGKSSPGGVYQDFPTVPGDHYQLTFDIGYPIGPSDQVWYMLVTDGTNPTPLMWGPNPYCTASWATCWARTPTPIFVAGAGSTTRISFSSSMGGSEGPHIDNVTLAKTA